MKSENFEGKKELFNSLLSALFGKSVSPAIFSPFSRGERAAERIIGRKTGRVIDVKKPPPTPREERSSRAFL